MKVWLAQKTGLECEEFFGIFATAEAAKAAFQAELATLAARSERWHDQPIGWKWHAEWRTWHSGGWTISEEEVRS